MNITQIKYFVSFSETLNFSHTAFELYTSRQNVSHAVRSLENELGVKLYEEVGNKIQLTGIGVDFARRAAKTVKSFEDLSRDFAKKPGESEKDLRFAVDIAFLSNSSPFFKTMDTFRMFKSNKCNVIAVEETCGTCYEMVVRRQADLCLVACLDRIFPQCERVKIAEYPMGLLVSEKNQLSKLDLISVDNLKDAPIIMPPGYAFSYHRLLNECEREGFSLQPLHVLNEGASVTAAVRENIAVAVADLGESATAPEMGMRVIPFEKPLVQGLYLVFRKDSDSKRLINQFVEFLSEDNQWKRHKSSTGYNRWASENPE